jgi:hypothetical protein
MSHVNVDQYPLQQVMTGKLVDTLVAANARERFLTLWTKELPLSAQIL